jgi:hypothetical protein
MTRYLQLHRIGHLRGATSVLNPCNDVTAYDDAGAHQNTATRSVFAQQNIFTSLPPYHQSSLFLKLNYKPHNIFLRLKHFTMAPRTLLTATRSLRAPIPSMRIAFTTRRTFLSSPTLRIKEDADRSPEQVEAAKQEQLREQEKGEGRWREDLASHGESNIAADKQQVNDHDAHMKELQKEGKEKGEKGQM